MKFSAHTINEELSIFEKKFAEAAKSKVPLLDRIMQYIIRRKGKQLRPMFVFLSAKLHAPINESTYRAASLVELLHTATLVHDDVVDESLERRGFFQSMPFGKTKLLCWWAIIFCQKDCFYLPQTKNSNIWKYFQMHCEK
jgi:octaprenyl-diphosphate synthase